ncbi:hypothetical protein BDV25DRAFT_138623 [Aspergillus avenaceus]|uniref:Uncharacterized protein n=1 Tax=Aspergillus avenaceus TaxID=36643 RepID=A0A5N6TZD1_ASPAV|nr:hypothetical protein BDV25DRAFT_138623 [Aspergillus avenaceus]
MPEVPKASEPPSYEHGILIMPSGCALESFGRLKRGNWYLRVGRTSTRAGICNGVLTTCNWVGSDRYRFDENGNQVDLGDWTTKEHLILDRTTQGEKDIQCEFGWPGDSGSLVIDQHGKVCGLYYGNATSWISPESVTIKHASAGLAMDMTEVRKGIRLRTRELVEGRKTPGSIVRLPF